MFKVAMNSDAAYASVGQTVTYSNSFNISVSRPDNRYSSRFYDAYLAGTFRDNNPDRGYYSVGDPKIGGLWLDSSVYTPNAQSVTFPGCPALPGEGEAATVNMKSLLAYQYYEWDDFITRQLATSHVLGGLFQVVKNMTTVVSTGNTFSGTMPANPVGEADDNPTIGATQTFIGVDPYDWGVWLDSGGSTDHVYLITGKGTVVESNGGLTVTKTFTSRWNITRTTGLSRVRYIKTKDVIHANTIIGWCTGVYNPNTFYSTLELAITAFGAAWSAATYPARQFVSCVIDSVVYRYETQMDTEADWHGTDLGSMYWGSEWGVDVIVTWDGYAPYGPLTPFAWQVYPNADDPGEYHTESVGTTATRYVQVSPYIGPGYRCRLMATLDTVPGNVTVGLRIFPSAHVTYGVQVPPSDYNEIIAQGVAFVNSSNVVFDAAQPPVTDYRWHSYVDWEYISAEVLGTYNVEQGSRAKVISIAEETGSYGTSVFNAVQAGE